MTFAACWLLLTITHSDVRIEPMRALQECEWVRADYIDGACDRFDDAKRLRCYEHVARKYVCRPCVAPRTATIPCFKDGSGTCIVWKIR